MKPVRILADTGLNDSVRNIFVPLKKSVMRPDYPSGPENFPIFPKNNFIIKALPLLTPIIVCQRGPRDRSKRRTKKGAAHTCRLPPEIPARSACQSAHRKRARQKCPNTRPWSGGSQRPRAKRAAQQNPGSTGADRYARQISEHEKKPKE